MAESCPVEVAETKPRPCDKVEFGSGAGNVTISESALNRLQQNSTASYPAEREKMLAELEAYWKEKEKCIEETHDEEYGLTKEFIQGLENELGKTFETKYPCNYGQEVMDSYLQHQGESPLVCWPEVKQYIECIDAVRQKLSIRLSLAIKDCAKENQKK